MKYIPPQILFILLTHAIWSCIFSSYVTPCFFSSAPSSDHIPRQSDADAHLTSQQVPTPDIIPSNAPANMTFSIFRTFQLDTLSLPRGTGPDSTDCPLLKYDWFPDQLCDFFPLHFHYPQFWHATNQYHINSSVLFLTFSIIHFYFLCLRIIFPIFFIVR